MRFLILLVALAVVVVVVMLLYYAITDSRSGPSDTRWEPHTESSGGRTRVLVREMDASGRERGRQVIASIADGDPDWDTRYHEAMAEARSRVAALRIEKE